MHRTARLGLGLAFGCTAGYAMRQRFLAAKEAATEAPKAVSDIVRFPSADPRMSPIVIHNGLIYLSGQVPDLTKLDESDITAQTWQTLAKVDDLLAQAGSSKQRVLSATIWIKDMKDFAAMNKVWCEWVDPECKPARACVEAPMAKPGILFEVMIVAAK